MSADSAASRFLPSAPRLRSARSVWRAAAVATLVALVLAAAFDRWNAAQVEVDLRTRVLLRAAPTAQALRSAVERRVALLEGLWSFAESQPSRGALDAQFPLYARGLLASTNGVRAVQFVQDGRIVSTWPLEGNERALGYDLANDPRSEIREGLERGLRLPGPVVTGPISLVQGGTGLLVRKRLTPRPGMPDQAAIILDVPTMVAEAGVPAPVSGLRMEVRDRSAVWFGGDDSVSVRDPVVSVVTVPDGDWTLRTAPEDGWDAAVAHELRSSRVGLLGFVLAVTLLGVLVGQRQARLASNVEERESQLGVALRAGRMGAWELDVLADRQEFSAEAAAVLGRSAEEVSGPLERLFRVVHPEDAPFAARVILEVLASDRPDYTLEHRVVLSDGAVRWVFVTGEVERDASGQAIRVRGIVTDASDRRAIESRARQLERVEILGTMAGGVAHDFNNLLTAMTSFADLALDQLRAELPRSAASRSVESDLEELQRTAARARSLTRQLLAFSRGASGEPRLVDVRRTLTEMDSLLRRVLGQRIQLEVRAADDVPQVWIDPSQLTQIVLNLAVNARDAIAANGTIRVRLHRRLVGPADDPRLPRGDWVVLEVEDTGAGMTGETAAQIFEPYFTTKTEARGTGLGLAVVRGVVRGAGGHAFVESELGTGTRFTILLPPAKPPARDAGVPTSAAS